MRPATTDQGLTVFAAASLLGGAAGLLVVWTAARRWYRDTIGRRRNRYDRLARLGTGAQLSFFTSVLGEPPAMRRTIVKDDCVEYLSSDDPDFDPALSEYGVQERRVTQAFTVCTFIDRDYYVQTISDGDETVLAFSVTTRSPRFRPIFQVHRRIGPIERWRWRRRFGEPYQPLVDIKLGRTTFADLDSTDADTFAPPHFRIAIGAHNHAYSEFSSFGNPGHYQSFAWTASDVARHGRFGDGIAVTEEVGEPEWPDPEKDPDEEPAWDAMPQTQRFRRETVITSYTVIHMELPMHNYPLGRFGPHENEVRTLP
jgi:hypothetical protein